MREAQSLAMIDRRCMAMVLVGVLAPAIGWAGEPTRGLPVQSVLELFTSQSCSACPPADALFVTLAREPGTLALTLPVTIWDHLGWKDTLAQKVFSDRQKHYSKVRGDRSIYTPQAVVNGTAHVPGGDLGSIEQARAVSERAGAMRIAPVLALREGRWHVALPKGGAAGQVLLMRFERSLIVAIGRGENSGRSNRYANVVRSIHELGRYAGETVELPLPTEAVSNEREGFAVLIQSGGLDQPGAILGAAEAPR